MSLLGHVIRADIGDPMREVVCEGYALYPRILPKKRAGRPRAMWLAEAYQEAYKIIKQDENAEIQVRHETLDSEPIAEIAKWAQERRVPFQTKIKVKDMNAMFSTNNEVLDQLGYSGDHSKQAERSSLTGGTAEATPNPEDLNNTSGVTSGDTYQSPSYNPLLRNFIQGQDINWLARNEMTAELAAEHECTVITP